MGSQAFVRGITLDGKAGATDGACREERVASRHDL